MSDTTKNDSDKFVPPQWLVDETPAPKGLPAWLDGLDPPDDAPPEAPGPRPDSWPELIPLTKTPGKPPQTVSPAPGLLWSESTSWPDLPSPSASEVDDCSEVNLGQLPRPSASPSWNALGDLSHIILEPLSRPAAPAAANTPEETVEAVVPPAEPHSAVADEPPLTPVAAPEPVAAAEPAEAPVPSPAPLGVMAGVCIVRDDFVGLNRLRGSFGLPQLDSSAESFSRSSVEPSVPLPNGVPEPPPETQAESPAPTVAEQPEVDRVEIESVSVSPSRPDLSVTYGITVRNTTPEPRYQVRVEHDLPPGPRYLSAGPAPDVRGTTLVWDLGMLEPGAARQIQVTVQPNYPGEIADDAMALFRLFQCIHCRAPVRPSALAGTLTVPDGRAPAPTHNGTLRPAGTEQFVLFTLADTDFAVPIRNVVEVGRATAITPLPNLPDWVLGVTDVRGDLVSLVDLALFLGLPRGADGPPARVLVARSGDTVAGLVVDGVTGVRDLARPTDGSANLPAPDRARPFILGVADYNDRPLVFLDLDRLFQSPAMRQFSAA